MSTNIFKHRPTLYVDILTMSALKHYKIYMVKTKFLNKSRRRVGTISDDLKKMMLIFLVIGLFVLHYYPII